MGCLRPLWKRIFRGDDDSVKPRATTISNSIVLINARQIGAGCWHGDTLRALCEFDDRAAGRWLRAARDPAKDQRGGGGTIFSLRSYQGTSWLNTLFPRAE